jgi:hypothetical protein
VGYLQRWHLRENLLIIWTNQMFYICLAIGFPFASGNATETQDADFGWWLTEISVGLWLPMPTVGRAVEVSGLSWQLVTAIWDGWRWWCDTLWVTPMRLWEHTMPSYQQGYEFKSSNVTLGFYIANIILLDLCHCKGFQFLHEIITHRIDDIDEIW